VRYITTARKKNGPFLTINCSALPESLLESELFGHVKGSFTGAVRDRKGRFEEADGGTIFLDESGEISPYIQVKLLRVLQEKEIERVGDSRRRKVNIRIVAATNKKLFSLVSEGHFRQDLYYRVSAFPIVLPPLRNRLDDLSLLSATLLKRIKGAEECSLSEGALACLSRYRLPGNVRELRNILERASLMADSKIIRTAHLPDEIRGLPLAEGVETRIIPLREMEQRYLSRVLDEFDGDRGTLARLLGISERTLFRKLQKIRG